MVVVVHYSEELALQATEDNIPLLFTHKLIDVVGPALTLFLEVFHAVAHDVEFFCPFVELPCQVVAPALIGRR